MAAEVKQRDPLEELGVKLISSDNHVNEPRGLFTSRFPAHSVMGIAPFTDAR
jgi:hypothetical protein